MAWGSRKARVATSAGLLAALALVARAGGAETVPGHVAERRPLVQRLVASGRVMPAARVALATLSLAKVVEVTVREGDPVRAGQLLVQLDDTEARAALAQARARVEEAAARIELVRGTSRTAAEAVRRSDLHVAHAEKDLDRTQRLFDAGAASEAQLDEAEEALAMARSEAERAAIQATSLAAAGADQRLAAAALRQAQAAEAVARAKVAEKQIRAPAAAGRVLVRDVEPGDVVHAGRTVLVLAQDGPVRLTIHADEKNLPMLADGQEAEAVADAFPGQSFRAVVRYIAPAVDPARGTIEVRLAIPAPPAFLRPDMTVSVNVTVGREEDALVLPAEAVRDLAGSPWVLRIEEGHATRRAVTIGARGEGMVEVLDGLLPGDVVVPPAAGSLAAGARVRVRRPAELARAL